MKKCFIHFKIVIFFGLVSFNTPIGAGETIIYPTPSAQPTVQNAPDQVNPPLAPEHSSSTIANKSDYYSFPQGMILASSLEPENEESPPVEEESIGYVINFDNVGIIEYLRWISNITNKNFIFDENELQFNITIISKEPATTDLIMASLLQILRIHNLALMEQENNIIIYKGSDKPSTTVISTEDEFNPEANALVTKVFKLKNAQPSGIAKIIKPLLSKNALVESSMATRHLIVTDLAINIQKVEQLLQTLDQPNVGLDIGIYHVKHINLKTLVSLAERIVTPLAEENPLILVPQHSTDTVFIISTPYLIEKTASVMSTLDINADILSEEQRIEGLPLDHIDRTIFKVHKLKYHEGSSIQTSLRKIGMTLSKTGIANEELVSTINTIEWLEATNSLVFSGDPESIAKLNELINTLDIPKREVFIEMLVIETSVLKALTIGIDVGGNINSTHGDLVGGFSGKGLQTLLTDSMTGNMNQASTDMIKTLGDGFNMGAIGKAISLGGSSYLSLGALVNALQGDSETSIIMNPQIVTESAHPAELFVGQTDRFQSSAIQGTQGAATVTNFEYRKIGSRLLVTPTVGNSNIVTLDIDQTIETNLGATASGGDGVPMPVLSTKNTRTRVHIPDKYFLILSGMITEKKTRKRAQVPCLGSIPLLGSVLGNVENEFQKTNIMIFVRPHIIDTPGEIEELSSQRKDLLEQEWKAKDVNFQVDGLLDWLELKDREH